MSASQHNAAPEFVRAMGPVARELLGEPNESLSTDDELRFGTRGSLSVRLDKGTFYDNEAGQGGGVVDLVRHRRHLEKPDAIAWMRERGHLPPSAKSKREVATYDYRDEVGGLLFQVVRFEPKDFRQRRPEGSGWVWKMAGVRRVLFRLPETIAAIAAGRTIYITEGEKGALALTALGLDATCSPGGAGKWRAEYTPSLAGADVVILPDNDQPGRDHAAAVARDLTGIHGAARIRVLALPGLPEKGDVADWIASGRGWQELESLAEYQPDAEVALDVQADAAIAAQENTATDISDLELTEHGIALEFTSLFKDQLRYCHHTGGWFVWCGTHWRRNETKLAFSWARRLVAKLNRTAEFKTKVATGKAAFSAAVERYAQADEAFAVTSEVWDRDLFLLGTPGGTVDLRTGLLTQARQGDYITKLTAVAPAASADCPLWIKFLNEAMGNDQAMIRYLQQWFGYCLTGDIREQSLTFCHGAGENGKGVCVNSVAGVMGAYARNAPMDTFTSSHGDRHPTELAMLRGARMVTASETEEGRAWAEARIKTLTGGDTVTARFMRQDFFEYLPQFKLTFMGNHKPVLKNVDHAARRRFKMAPFLNKPLVKDPQLPEKLKAEWPGILRWAIDGCLDWQANGLMVPQAIEGSTEQYFSEQDTLGQWMEDCCNVKPGLADMSVVLWRSWQAYCLERGDQPGGSKGFSQTLIKRGFAAIKNADGIRGRGFAGLRLRITNDEEQRP